MALSAGADIIVIAGASLLPFPRPHGDGFFRLRFSRGGARRGGLGSKRRSGFFFVALRNPTLFLGNDHERDQEKQAHEQAAENEQQAIEVQIEAREKIGSQTGSRKHHDQQTDSHQGQDGVFFRHRKVCLTPIYIALYCASREERFFASPPQTRKMGACCGTPVSRRMTSQQYFSRDSSLRPDSIRTKDAGLKPRATS